MEPVPHGAVPAQVRHPGQVGARRLHAQGQLPPDREGPPVHPADRLPADHPVHHHLRPQPPRGQARLAEQTLIYFIIICLFVSLLNV